MTLESDAKFKEKLSCGLENDLKMETICMNTEKQMNQISEEEKKLKNK